MTASFSTAGIEEKYSAPDISGVTVSCKCKEGDSAAAVYKALDDAFAVKGYTMDPSASDPAEVSLPSPMTITVPVENGSEEGGRADVDGNGRNRYYQQGVFWRQGLVDKAPIASHDNRGCEHKYNIQFRTMKLRGVL